MQTFDRCYHKRLSYKFRIHNFVINNLEKGNNRHFSRRTIVRCEFARIRRLFANLFSSRTLVNDWRTLGELPRTLAEFARIRANSSGVRRELADSSPKNFSIRPFPNFRRTIGERPFAANNYHSTNCSPRTTFWRTIVRRSRTIVRRKFLKNWRTTVRGERSFALEP